ncbi:MAG TPA: amidase [Candidatus Saccharimonadales bacterium]|nr:amidase [Candidatus Saccharimonadales bacterium]
MNTHKNHLSKNEENQKEYISLLCKNIELVDKTLHSFLPEKDRQKRLEKDVIDLKKRSGETLPLYGATVGIKDIFLTDDLPTQAGSLMPIEEFRGKQADIVTKLKNAGALILGKTVTTEFAYAEPNETVNPVNSNYTPGGSSSGSAAAVAAGLCDLGVGSQTVGSTLRPASYCGVVGFKCSYGRINKDGLIGLSPTLDTVGLFTTSVSSIIPFSQVLLQNWKGKERKNTNPVVLGIPVGNYLDQAEKKVLEKFRESVKKLEDNRFIIKEISIFENIYETNEDIWTLVAFEMAELHKDWYPKFKKLYRPKTKELIKKGLRIRVDKYKELLEKQVKLRYFIKEEMNKHTIDFWISPAATSYAPKTLEYTGNPAMNIPWTYSGMPSISLPIKDSGDLPLGLQVIAPFMDDEKLLSESLHIERSIS